MRHHQTPFSLGIALLLRASCVLGVNASTSFGSIVHPGDIMVADPDFVHVIWENGELNYEPMQAAIWKIDPRNGIREVVTSKTKGGGAPLRSATAVVVDRCRPDDGCRRVWRHAAERESNHGRLFLLVR